MKQVRVGVPEPVKIKFAHGKSQSSQAEINWCEETSASLGYVVRYGTNPSDLNQFKNIAANLVRRLFRV